MYDPKLDCRLGKQNEPQRTKLVKIEHCISQGFPEKTP